MSSIETPAALVRRPSADIFGAIGQFHCVNIPHQATQSVQLIEQMQDDGHALVVHAEIQPEILDQPRPREVGLGKKSCLSAGQRHQPLCLDPGIQRRSVKMRSGDELLGLHHHTPMDCRGLYSTGCHSATNASSFGSGFSGSISISLMYSSPLLPSARGTPRPFSRRTRPVLDHFGTATVTVPPGVGTLTLAPSTASFREIGKSRWMSSPLRVK